MYILGSEVVVGLFDSLRMFTQNVGKLVNIVGDRLEDRRDGVVRVASEVDSQVGNKESFENSQNNNVFRFLILVTIS